MLQKFDDLHKKKEKHHDQFSEYLRLKDRYQSKPYHERNLILFKFASVGSWFSNLVSGITESAKIFVFVFGIVGSLAFGNLFAFVLTLGFIVFVELVHRYIARSYFKEYILNNGHTRGQNGNLFGMILCLVISAGLSIAGQFDVLRILMNPPQVAQVEEVNVKAIQTAVTPILTDAKNRVNNYYKRRNYKGRLASEDKHKYRQYEDHAQAMEDSIMSIIKQIPSINTKAKQEAREQYIADKALYQQEIQTKGIGLVFITIPAILMMYLCLYFEEKYFKRKMDYLEGLYAAATDVEIHKPAAMLHGNPAIDVRLQQLAQDLNVLLQQDQHISNTSLSQGINTHGIATDSNGMNNFLFGSKFPKAQQKAKELLQYVAIQKANFPDDKYTILHFSFKNGQSKRYTRDRVDWFVKHYQEQVDIAAAEDVSEDVAINRQSKLLYWLERQKELHQKLGVAIE